MLLAVAVRSEFAELDVVVIFLVSLKFPLLLSCPKFHFSGMGVMDVLASAGLTSSFLYLNSLCFDN